MDRLARSLLAVAAALLVVNSGVSAQKSPILSSVANSIANNMGGTSSPRSNLRGGTFFSTLSPLQNTTGVGLGGYGTCTLVFSPEKGNGFSKVNVSLQLDPAVQGSVIAIHIQKGTPKENGPVAVGLCASGRPYNQKPIVLETPGGTRIPSTAPPCNQNGGEYAPAALLQPEDATFSTVQRFFELFAPNPEGFYCNVHTSESEKIKPTGLIRGQFFRESGVASAPASKKRMSSV